MLSDPINVQRELRTLSIHPSLRRMALASAFVALTAQYGHAQERTLIGINGGPNVIVWKIRIHCSRAQTLSVLAWAKRTLPG